MSEINKVDIIVIGAGVIGLAIAKNFAQQKKDVIVIEKENIFGSVTSNRNSGVIHAGIYYDAGSCLLYTSPSPRDLSTSRMPSSA